MFRNLALPATFAALISGAAMADPVPVAEINVTADLTAIQTAEAGTYWANLETDLGNAIATRVAGQTADDGVKVTVRLDAVSLGESYSLMNAQGQAFLEGRVIVTGAQYSDGYLLRVGIGESALTDEDAVTPAVIMADSETYYRAMIDAFADRVADKLG